MTSPPSKPKRRLFASSLPPAGGDIVLDPAASAHARVLRLTMGDRIKLFDGRGAQALGEILRFEGDLAHCRAESPERRDQEEGRVVLVQCLPKASKLDVIVRMATELGVSEIHLAQSERTVPRPRSGGDEKRLARLERVAQEAARQSGYDHVPPIFASAPLLAVAERATHDPLAFDRWLLTPAGPRLDTQTGSEGVWLVVGPEGGLSNREIEALSALGYVAARMTETTLRVETAAPIAVAFARDRLARRFEG